MKKKKNEREEEEFYTLSPLAVLGPEIHRRLTTYLATLTGSTGLNALMLKDGDLIFVEVKSHED